MKRIGMTGLPVIFIGACMTWTAPVSGADPEPVATVMSLEDFVALALKNNPDLKAEAISREIAERGVEAEEYYWEPEFTASGKKEENKRQNTVQQELSQFSPVFEERNWGYSAGVEGALASGARWRLGYTLDDLKNNLTNLTYRQRDVFESEFVSFAGVTLTQPLLRGFGPRVTKSQLENARLRWEIAAQELRRRQMLTIGRAELAYWGLWQSHQSVALREQSLGIARALLEDNEKRQKQGRMSEIEVEQAKAGVALRERRWLEARTQQREAARGLLSVVGWAPGEPVVDVDPDAKPDTEVALPEFDAVMNRALEAHPDMLIRKKEIEVEDLRLAVAKNQRWPQLDLVGSYGLNGLGDDMNESWNYLSDGEYVSWAVSLNLRVPLGGGRKAGAQQRQAKLRKEHALVNYKATESDLANGLKSTLDRVRLVRDTLAALDREVGVTRAALDAEKVLLENGKSTSRRVLELEEDLSNAKVDQVLAAANLRRVLVELDMTNGDMLKRHGVEGEPAADAAPVEKRAEAP